METFTLVLVISKHTELIIKASKAQSMVESDQREAQTGITLPIPQGRLHWQWESLSLPQTLMAVALGGEHQRNKVTSN